MKTITKESETEYKIVETQPDIVQVFPLAEKKAELAQLKLDKTAYIVRMDTDRDVEAASYDQRILNLESEIVEAEKVGVKESK